MTRYLSKYDMLDLHAFVLERYGGRMGIKSQDRLTTALAAPQQVMFGAELYTDLAGKAGALIFSLLKSRPFASGNEATALLALLRFLDLNSARLADDVANADLVALLSGVSRSDIDRNALEVWLRERVVVGA